MQQVSRQERRKERERCQDQDHVANSFAAQPGRASTIVRGGVSGIECPAALGAGIPGEASKLVTTGPATSIFFKRDQLPHYHITTLPHQNLVTLDR